MTTVPNPGVPQLCQSLTDMRVPFCIATTSGKPRVPISVKVWVISPMVHCVRRQVHTSHG